MDKELMLRLNTIIQLLSSLLYLTMATAFYLPLWKKTPVALFKSR